MGWIIATIILTIITTILSFALFNLLKKTSNKTVTYYDHAKRAARDKPRTE